MTTKIKVYGLWLYPVVIVSGIVAKITFLPNSAIDWKYIAVLLVVSFLGSMIIAAQNFAKIKNGKKESEIGVGVFQPDPYGFNSGRQAAMFPKIMADEMLFDHPTSYTFGLEYKTGKYICLADNRSVLCCAGSGGGKSSCGVIPFVALNKNKYRILYLDPKGEITDLTYKPQDPTIIFKPGAEHGAGIEYDPFFRLTSESSEQSVYEVMSLIAISLIPHAQREDIWQKLARSTLAGLLVYGYCYKDLKDFTSVIQYIFSNSLRNVIDEIVEKTTVGSVPYSHVIQLQAASDEVVANVSTNLSDAVRVFAVDEKLRGTFGAKGEKWSPEILRYKNVALCLSTGELAIYSSAVYLILNQVMTWIMELPEHRDEPNRKPIAIVFEESVAVMNAAGGRLENLGQMLRFARSKGAFMILCAQSIAGLTMCMGAEETEDMLSNLPHKIFYSGNDLQTISTLKNFGGTFLERTDSWTKGDGKSSRQTSFVQSYVLREADILTLPASGDAIIISERIGYARVKKVPFYSNKYIQQYINSV